MTELSFLIIGTAAMASLAFNGFINTLLCFCAGLAIGSLLMPLFN